MSTETKVFVLIRTNSIYKGPREGEEELVDIYSNRDRAAEEARHRNVLPSSLHANGKDYEWVYLVEEREVL